MEVDSLFTNRLLEIENVIYEQEEHRCRAERIIGIFKSIIEYLPDEHKNKILRFEELLTEESIMEQQIIYRQGLKDGMEIMAVYHEIINNNYNRKVGK